MSRETRPRRTPPAAPTPPTIDDPPQGDDAEVPEQSHELRKAIEQHRKLRSMPSVDYEHRVKVALAEALVWTIRAEGYADKGDADAARKAASTATEREQLARQLDRDTHADRLVELERRVSRSQGLAKRLKDLR